MISVSFNRMLPPVHSYGARPNPGPAELMRASQVKPLQKVTVPGARPLKIGGDFPGPSALLRGSQLDKLQKVQIPGAHLLDVGGAFPGPDALIRATRTENQQKVNVPGARPLNVAGPYPGPAALLEGTDPPVPTRIDVPGVQMGYKPPDSYLSLMSYLMNLHISLAPAPAGRETAPPSPKQAAIDAYTGR
jgi:hypothetical protein